MLDPVFLFVRDESLYPTGSGSQKAQAVACYDAAGAAVLDYSDVPQRLLITFVLLVSLSTLAEGQRSPKEPAVFLKRIETPIVIDGRVEEPGWFAGQPPAQHFWEYFPSDTAQAPAQFAS